MSKRDEDKIATEVTPDWNECHITSYASIIHDGHSKWCESCEGRPHTIECVAVPIDEARELLADRERLKQAEAKIRICKEAIRIAQDLEEVKQLLKEREVIK